MGKLDGLTVLRFTHASAEGGGVEQYLGDLNRLLLARNKMTIVQLELPKDPPLVRRAVESHGRGELVRYFMRCETNSMPGGDTVHERNGFSPVLRRLARDVIAFNRVIPMAIRQRVIARSRVAQEREPQDLDEVLHEAFRLSRPDVVIVHLAGGRGAKSVIERATQRKVPCAILNHFVNDRYRSVGVRLQAESVGFLAGVSDVDVPRYARSRFTNLSDGVDTCFFDPSSTAIKMPQSLGNPFTILLPARVTPGKGHTDVVRAVAGSRQRDVCQILFAGRIDSEEVRREAARLARASGIESHVRFLGHLPVEQLRSRYSQASVVVLPSSSEGLGRVLLEAQAMATPVVAYDVGGVSEALIDRETGFLVSPGSVRGLRGVIDLLAKDPQLGESIGEAGRRFVDRRFSMPALAARHERWYWSMILAGSAKERLGSHRGRLG